MKRKISFFVVAFALVVAVGLVLRPRRDAAKQDLSRVRPDRPSVTEKKSPVVLASVPQVAAAPVDSPPAVKSLREWATRYFVAPASQQAAMETQGVALAKEHVREIAAMIRRDPQAAIANAVPMVMRQKLPPSIVALLEERVRVKGALEVYGNVPMEKVGEPIAPDPTIEPYTRTVTKADGTRRWNAFVYGRRLSQRTISTAQLNGIAVERDMAVSDSPVRVLEVGEAPQPEGREVVEVCPISGIQTPIEETPSGDLPAITTETPAFETAERIIYVCSGGHISQVAEKFASQEEYDHWQSLGVDLNSGAGSGSPNGPILGTIPSSSTTGNRTFLYIRATFPDSPTDPQTDQECYDSLKAMSDYILQTSYGRCYFTYAVPPLVVLPYPLAWYSRYDTEVGGGDTLIQSHARQIAKSLGYDYNNYSLDSVRWNGGPGAYGGSASVGGRGMRLKTSSSGTFIHELGHNLGVWHANFWRTTPPSITGPGNNLEYGNIFDVMGNSGSSGQFTASFKNTLSWMPQEQFWNVTTSGVYRIYQTDAATADPNFRYAIRIRNDVERDYWAEFRQRINTNTGFMNGLYMTWDRWGLSGIGGSGGAPLNGSNAGAQLLDMTPGSFGNGITDTRNDSALWLGRTYSDPNFNIHITPIAKNTGTTPPSMDVRVQIGDEPGNQAPTLSINASSTSVAAGTNVTLTATATDPDGDSLAYAWVFGDGNYSLDNSATQTKSWATAGHYSVLCTASDMKGKRTTRSVLITVGSPSTFTVSGTITGNGGAPLEGVYVANYAPSNSTSHSNSGAFKGTWTDSDGKYTITGLAAGSFTITPNLYPLAFTANGFTNPVTVGPNVTNANFTSASLPTITISYPDDTANEGAVPGTATIRLNREGDTTNAVSVQIYNVNSGSATRNTDYTLSPGPTAATSPDGGSGTSEYVIPAGASFLDITLTPVNDSTAEGIEYASLDFVNTASGYIMAGNPRAVVPIIDDESQLPVVKMTAVDDSGNEAGGDTITLKLERNVVTASALNVSITYTGTATNVSDFTGPATVSIPANSASTTFVITPVNDTGIETTETVIATIATNAAYLRDSTAQTVTSILNDDDMPVVAVAATDASASETGADKGMFTITRTGAMTAALTVDYSMGGRAILGSDYRRLDGRAVIPIGSATTTVEIVPLDDTVDEGLQDVIFQLRTTQNYVIGGTGQATVTIADNDASQVYVKLNTATGVEPASGSANGPVFQITRPASGTAITVNYSITGTATTGVDFTALPGTIAFATGDTSKTITVSMLADAALEDTETVTLTITSGSGYTLMQSQLSSMTAYIYDGDQEVVDVNVADSATALTTQIAEATAAGEDFLITRRVATASPLTVSYTMSGTATEGVDYTGTTGTATIPANDTGVYVHLTPVNDTTPEGVESIVLTVTPSTGYGVRFGSATMLMADNDSFSGISVGFGSSTATTTETVGTFNVPVNITGTPPGDVSVRYRLNGGTAVGNGIDFTFAAGELTFASGETTKNISIPITADVVPESAETLVLQLFNATGANLGTSGYTLTINNVSMPEAFTDTASSILATSATLNGHVYPNGLATTVWFEYGGTTTYGSTTGTQSIGSGTASVNVNSPVTGLTLAGYHFRCVAQNSMGTTYGIDQFFGSNTAPVATTLAATNVTGTSVTLNGTANPNTLAGTAWFEYGPTTSYGSTTTPSQSLPATTNDIAVAKALTGLSTGSTYHYRLVVQTGAGMVFGDDMSFSTPSPTFVRTGSFAGVGQTGFSLDGIINPGGDTTNYYFEYGADTSYGQQTPTQSAGNGATNVIVRCAVQGLTPDTTYHVRLVATNTFGSTIGDDQVVTTLPDTSAMIEPEFLYRDTGTSPLGALIVGADGLLYGTTNTGGTFNAGTVFRVSTNGTATTLGSFYNNTNFASSGANPQSNLTLAPDGNYYGTTNAGGVSGSGSVFRLTPDGELTTLVSFTNTSGPTLGANPITGLTLGADGALYGVTQNGGSGSGTIFKVTTNGVFNSLVSFTGTTGSFLGSSPRGNLVLASDGSFYGTTATGGSGGGFGTIFKYTPGTNTFVSLVSFTGTTGAVLGSTPLAGLVQGPDGNFYGTTSLGGNVSTGLGTVFQMTPAGVVTTLVNFGGLLAPLGIGPKGTLVFGADGQLYGTTQTGGTGGAGLGTVFKVTTAGVLTTLANFTGSTGTTLGQSPAGLLAHADGSFYGTTNTGGVNNIGSVFKITADGVLTTLHSFTAAPVLSKLKIANNGNLYGTTNGGGGSPGYGTVIKGPPGGAMSVVTTLVPTSGTTAWSSRGGFVQTANGDLWATSAAGGIGTGNSGSVFKVSSAGVFTTVIGFSGTTGTNLGSSPQAELILGADGNLWGTTSTGGNGVSNGTIFNVVPGTGAQTTVLSFSGTTGSNLGSSAQSPLVLALDGNYYGTTNNGGTGGGFGTIYKITPAGVQTTLVNFTGQVGPSLGGNPQGAMVQAADGNFYGTTNTGGVRNLGTVFRMTPAGVLTTLASFGGNNVGELRGQNPTSGLVIDQAGHLYGTTSGGGIYSQGTLFRVTTDGTVTSLYSFSGRDEGSAAANGLAAGSDGALHGVTSMGMYKFNMPPVPTTIGASSITAVSATLNGGATPGAVGCITWIEYGAGSAFNLATSQRTLGAGYSPLTLVLSEPLTGLQPLLTYRCRTVVDCSLGRFYGAEVTFSTSNSATFNAVTDVPTTVDGYTATGITPTLSLGFAPASGTVLTLVSNTGFLPVNGAFNGLPEGAAITLLFGSTPYLFQISYIGGDGNDITLTQVDQVITFPTIPTKYVGDAAFALTATASSGLPVTYQIVAGGSSASVAGSTITLTSTTGTITVKATQAGDGGSIGAAIPVYQTFALAAGNSGFTVVTASKGNDFALGIRANGTLWAWGVNANGQLGDASTTLRRTPVQVGTATNWRTVSAGTSHVVATRTDNTMWAWGLNTSSQVGDASVTQRTAPVQIGTTSDWANAVAGANHCVAVKTDGTLWAWGANASGQVGQGNTTTATYNVPTQIVATTPPPVTNGWQTTSGTLSAGGDFTLALQTDGTLWAWGLNSSSQLGDASTTTRSAPVKIGSATTWSRVAASSTSSAALRSDGTLWTWGLNSSGQLGDNLLTNRNAPTQIGAATNWQSIAAGASHVLAKKTDGTFWSWGANTNGQLGLGFADALARTTVPAQIGALTDWSAYAGGTNFTVAVRADGSLWTWGSNANGQLGYFPRTALPVSAQFGAVQSASGGANHTLLIRPDGSLWGFGSNSSGQLGLGFTDGAPHAVPLRVGAGFSWLQASAGSSQSFAIRADGTLWASGGNGSGQLGDGTILTRSVWTQIGTASNWRAVATGNTHTLALKTDGTLWAWGANASGQLGDGTLVAKYSPIQIGVATDWNAIWAGNGGFSMAMKTDGSLWTWGEGSGGQLGDGLALDRSTPAQIGLTGDWRSVSAGSNHVLAVKSNGTLWAWGTNSNNQLGDGTTTQRNAPVQIGAVTTWASVSGAAFNSLATRTDGTLWTWGANTVGYLGTGNFTTRSTPGQVGASTGWSALPQLQSASHSLVIAADSTLWAFGNTNNGQSALAWRNQLVPDVALPAISPVQSITFAPTSTVPVGNAITLAATTGSGLPASYMISGPATLQRDKLTITGPGLVSVTAYQAGDNYWQSSDALLRLINAPAPTVTTLAATNVTTTTATLSAIINPNGSSTTAQFQRGATTSYGTNTAVSLSPVNGTQPQTVTLNLTGLTPATTYHFRATATNAIGTTNGADFVFTTISNNANLSALTTTAGALTPTFASGTLAYSVTVSNATGSATVTPTAANANATLTINSEPITSGTPSDTISLAVGANPIAIEVTAEDGVTVKTYTLNITRRTPYQEWAATKGIGGGSSLTGDFDLDGIPNLLEWAFGTNPAASALTSLVSTGGTLTARGGPVTQDTPGGRVAVFCRRANYVAEGLTYTVEFSPNLSDWVASTDPQTPIASDGEIEAVSVPFPALVLGQPARFFRVIVSAQ